MAKEYKWSTRVSFDNDNPALTIGVIGGDESWHTTSSTSGSAEAVYYYHDANVAGPSGFTDANSSRVDTKITDSWTASISDMNVLTITVRTKINYIERTNIVGANQNTPYRDISAYNAAGTRVFGVYTDTNLTSAHNISGEIDLGTQTLVLNPGESAERSTAGLHNQTTGASSYDDIKVGVRFQNPLPGPVTYKLSYNANGGSGAPAAESVTNVDDNHAFTVSSTIPTRANYRFDGWSESASGTATYHGGDTFTTYRGDPQKTLYAIWTRLYDYSVAYNANGGSGAPATQTYTGPETSHIFILSNTAPTWQYHKFDGWKYNNVMYQPGATVTLQSSTPVITMVAQWTPYWDATLTYDANGGSPTPAAQTAKVHPDTTSKSFTITDAAPAWGYYRFLGWSHIKYTDSRTMADVEYVAGDTFTIQKASPSKTLYAVWMMDYRPGDVKYAAGWKTTDRDGGKCHLRVNGSWVEMRTIDGGNSEGNPPSRRTSGRWKNQYRIGSD